MRAVVQTETDSADRRREVPDVWSFDRRGDDQQRSRSVVAAIVAKTPICARRNDLIGTFLWVQSKRANDISLRAAKNVADIKLGPAKGVYRGVGHKPILCLLVVRTEFGVHIRISRLPLVHRLFLRHSDESLKVS